MNPEVWHYLSFATEEGFRGVVVIKGHGIADCLSKCHRLGVNPGGQVRGFPFPDNLPLPDEADRHRLLSIEDVLRIWRPDIRQSPLR